MAKITVVDSTEAEYELEKDILEAICFVDVDGTLTDGGLYYFSNTVIAKRFHARDGHGFQLLREHKVMPVIMSRSNDAPNQLRAKWLKTPFFHTKDKLSSARTIVEFLDFQGPVFAMGDDVFDIPLLKWADLSGVPYDAHDKVLWDLKRSNANYYRTSARAGHGAFREFVEVILSRIT